MGEMNGTEAPTTRLDAVRGRPLPTVKVIDRTRTRLEVEDCRRSGSVDETRLLVSLGSGGGTMVSLTGDERRRLIAALFRFERDTSGEAL